MYEKRILPALLFVFCSLVIYADDIDEEQIDTEYAAKKYADRSEWLYEFNRTANKVHTDSLEVVKYAGGQYSGILSMAIKSFDTGCYRYRVLLDIGVQYSFIDHQTRHQQLGKLSGERDKVSNALSRASGLGL